MKETSSSPAVIIQTPLGLTERNSHSDNLEAIALMSAFAIFVVLAVLGWWSYTRFFGSPPFRRKSTEADDPVDTNKVPLYQESSPSPHYPIMPPK